jgi:REP element-mobilizing transposase RayT
MSQSLSKILLHIVFSTKDRVPLIQPNIEQELYAYLAKIIEVNQSHAFLIGGMPDHIHIACSLGRTISVAKLLEEMKRSSSRWIKTKGNAFRHFSWQAGYGAFSLGISQLPVLLKYIERQKEHHRFKTFQEEYVEFLEKYGIEYDPQYIWE